MSQSKYHTIKVKSKDPSQPPTGANTVVELDGKPLKYASFIKIECSARKVTKVLIELYAHAEIDTLGELETRVLPLKGK